MHGRRLEIDRAESRGGAVVRPDDELRDAEQAPGRSEMLPVVASKESPRGRSPVMVHVGFSPSSQDRFPRREGGATQRLELGWKEKEPSSGSSTLTRIVVWMEPPDVLAQMVCVVGVKRNLSAFPRPSRCWGPVADLQGARG